MRLSVYDAPALFGEPGHLVVTASNRETMRPPMDA